MRGSKTSSNARARAGQICVQLLLVSGRAHTLDSLRNTVREIGHESPDPYLREATRITEFELADTLESLNSQLTKAGLLLSFDHSGVKLTTTYVSDPRMSTLLYSYHSPERPSGLSDVTMTVLSCIALKQPITQAEIDYYFEKRDMRYHVKLLRGMGLVTHHYGTDSRMRFTTTQEFLTQFKLTSAEDFKALFDGRSKN